jgi:hypothetical protein
MENYEHIRFLDCPHFTVGRVDQWGESGYLMFDGNVYFYNEDRKNQCGTTTSPQTIDAFLIYANQNQIEIPDEFLLKLKECENESKS